MSNGSRRNSRQSPRQGITEAQGYTSPAYPASYQDGNSSNGVINAAARVNGYISPDHSLNGNPSPYPTTTQPGGAFAYPEPSPGSGITYANQNGVFGDQGYGAADPGIVNQLSPPVQNATAQSPAAPFIFANTGSTYTPPGPQHGQWHSGQLGSQSWRQWTGQMAVNLEPEHYSASALMALGAREQTTGEASNHATSGIGGVTNVDAATAQPWPLMIFDIGQNGVA